MAASIFSRASAAANGRPSHPVNRVAPVPAPTFGRIARWRDELAAVTSTDTDGVSSSSSQGQRVGNAPRLVLTQAHPGGLAQLYAEHTTRLSSLVRAPGAHARALERARAVLQRARELAESQGIGPVHLAIGRAQWVEGVPSGAGGRDEDAEGTGAPSVIETVRRSSPALLRPVDLAETDDDDLLITLRPGAEIGQSFAAALAHVHVAVDVAAIMADARTVHGFAPSRALDALRAIGAPLERFEVRDELALGIFEHPAAILLREYDRPGSLATSDIVRALAGDGEACARTATALPEANPADRDPWEELGAGDLTPRQQDVVEAVAAGRSLVIDAPRGSDDTAVLASLLTESGARGRSTVHIAGTPSRTARTAAALAALGVDEMTVQVDGSDRAVGDLTDRLGAAMSDTSAVIDAAEVEQIRTSLRRARAALASYTSSLHAPFQRFGVSAFDALQVLTDLTGAHPSPRTRVRLREDVLVAIARDQGERARTLLRRADTLDVFSRTPDHQAWAGIVINAAEQVTDVLVRVRRLAEESLPQMRVQMSAISGETGIIAPTTVEQWEQQLVMLEGVRDVLDVFHPSVFERSAADMVIATAPARWRREHGISMSHSQRMRLVRQARDLVLPGRHVEDLHRELLLVQERREVWREQCDSDGWPVLPSHLDRATALTASVREDLERLAPMFSTAYPNLTRMGITELGRLLDRLCADPDGARVLPQRVAVLKELQTLGLEDLVADLRERHVGGDQLDAELDLAWWASVLGLMLSHEPHLGGFDPARLEGLLAQERVLDVEQTRTLAPQALQQLRRLRQQALATRPEQHTDLVSALHAASSHGVPVQAADLYARHPLAWHLVPVVLTVPTLVPWLVPEGHRVDLVVLDGVDDLPLSELIPILARARQVVVLTDLSDARTGAAASLADVLPVARLDVTPGRLNAQVARLIQHHGSGHPGVLVPWTSQSGPVEAVWSAGTGMPAPGAASVESTAAETADVVDLVIAHAVEHPDRSLAVIALNARHAQRVRAAVEHAVEGSPGLAEFFSPDVVEPFAVVDVEHARGLSRDRIVVSVGFAKTPHGRVLHDFGVLSTPRGAPVLTDALLAVRGDLTVVSSFRASEVDAQRLGSEGARMLVDLLRLVEDEGGAGGAAAGADGAPDATGHSWPTLEAAPDRLLVDLADRLYGMGLEVVPNVGVPGGMRVPLAIGHPEVPGRLLVAVLTDDQAYIDESSLRMRDRVWPAMLEAQGWRVRTELSMAVFIDPEKEAQEIVQLVLDAVDDINGPATPPIDVPKDAVADVEGEESPDDVALDEAVALSDQARQRAESRTDAGREPEVSAEAAPLEPSPTEPVESAVERGPRPPIARGLPLAAYSDDQLDEIAQWLRSDGLERTQDGMVEDLRRALGLVRRGAQTDAVLANVARRTSPGR